MAYIYCTYWPVGLTQLVYGYWPMLVGELVTTYTLYIITLYNTTSARKGWQDCGAKLGILIKNCL